MGGVPPDVILNFKNKEYAICKQKCENIMISEPKNCIALIYLGHIAESEKDYETSIKYYKKVTEIEPRFPFIWSRIGEIFKEQEKFSEAFDAFVEEIAIYNKKAAPWCMASMCASKIGRYDLAVGILRLAQEKVEKDGQSIISYSLGIMEEVAGNNDEALVSYIQGQLSSKDDDIKNRSAKQIYNLLSKK